MACKPVQTCAKYPQGSHTHGSRKADQGWFPSARDIRDSADIAGTPIIAISASCLPNDGVQCADAAFAMAFISKPRRLEEVSPLLRQNPER